MLQYLRGSKKICMLSAAIMFTAYPHTIAKAKEPTPKKMKSTVSRQQEELVELRQRIKALEDRLLALPHTLENTAPALPLASQKVPIVNAALPANEQPSTTAPAVAVSRESGMLVDEEAAKRALERTLTQLGALLLQPGMIELTPSSSYSLTERELSRLALVSSPQGQSSISPVTYRRRETITFVGLGIRAGLPLAMQFEASLGANRLSVSEANDFGEIDRDRFTGRGDIAVAVAKTLVREKKWRPDLVGRVTYNFGSSDRQARLGQLPGGFRQIQGELMMLKRQDPIAFTLGTIVAHSFEKNGFQPGNTALVSIGAAVAASPQTSLQVAFTQVKNNSARLGGVKIDGSDQLYGIVALGASSVVTSRHTVIGQVGIGLGKDAPKFTASLSVPISFR